MADATGHDLVLIRTLAASPAHVYRCWTEAELLKRFFAPAPGITKEAVIEPWPGGRFFTHMYFEEYGDIQGEGCVLLAEPGRRLVFTDALSKGFRPNESPFFSADITFTEVAGGCEYKVIAKHATPDAAAKHAEMGFESGWGMVAEQLEAVAQAL